MKIVGFIGPKQSGKDTAAKMLKDNKLAHGKIAFAGPLKRLCEEVFGLHFQMLNDAILKEKVLKEPITLTRKNLRALKRTLDKYLPSYEVETGFQLYRPETVSITGFEHRVMKTPRELLQVIGTELIRNRTYEDWHIKAAFGNEALKGLKKNGVYCVTDIRFPNELEYLQNRFGNAFEAYYVERPEAEEVLQNATHASERNVIELKGLVKSDNVLENHGTMKDFEKLVLDLNLPKNDYNASDGNKFIYGRR